ncbi:ABC transporter substrate-binding protein [Sedimentitalea sp. JM2-8]|uniref:ABC transporter substrate-binding protein n=1 Tax=Sedimentitalea xiamensis TaxID=3050037 RepID=A0ABT7FJ74_9RHOB|nr:ABC transporter substrate-binding protein [Sedimentitalea xiamensis]MDK3074988.1 ABC transporter substrate-binding protein [Sedimentitalea xiamensis]
MKQALVSKVAVLCRPLAKPAAITILSLGLGIAAHAEGTLRIAMTASDVPLPNGQTDQGAEGMRFLGYQVFEALVAYDLSTAEKPVTLAPGLATEWSTDPDDRRKWTFKLRDGVTFHDGSVFDANAVIWNLDKILNPEAAQYDERQSAQGRGRVPTIESYRAVDDSTVEIVTTIPDALFPYQIAWIVMSSPAAYDAAGSWDEFLKAPAGTGPFKVDSYTPRESAVMVRSDAYWNADRMPEVDKLVILPVPDASARVAALRSGQVDWIESPPADAIASLRAAGFNISSNVYPHVWPWHFSMLEGSPWADIRVRKAANLAIDREGIKVLLDGLMLPAEGMVPPTSDWFGTPEFEVKYDPDAARAFMAEAGYSSDNPLNVKAIISPGGSGQMQPMLMNELIQQNLAAIGINVEFDVRDWNALLANWRAGATDATTNGAHSTNSSYFSQDPFTALMRHIDSRLVAPKGTNWGHYESAEADGLIDQIRSEFDAAKQLEAIQQLHKHYVDNALFLFVAHDVGPRAMAPNVQGFVQAQNWFQDLTSVTVK